jgi:glucose/arabinose dehydrogenase
MFLYQVKYYKVMRDSDTSALEVNLYKIARILFLLIIVMLVLTYHYRRELRAGYEHAKIKLFPEKPVRGSNSASFVGPWADLQLIPYESGFDLPVYLTSARDGSGRTFVVEKAGRIKVVKDGKVQGEPFLNIVDKVRSKESERGLLSVAFHPRYRENGRFFVDYTDLDGNTVISEFRAAKSPDVADAGSERILLKINQPASNHNGGQLQFGPDGYLYIGMGDGGFSGDPSGNGQNRNALLAKLLRIDVDNGMPYGIPKGNPFRGMSGARPEVWAYGLRNPWRFSFDSKTGDLYIADVGENKWEEVDFQPRDSKGGEDYGWNILEGSYKFKLPPGYDTRNLTFPVVEYGHNEGCSVTGGYVYRGKKYRSMDGTYFFADFCSGKLWGLKRKPDGSWEWAKFLDTGHSVSSFGVDEEGDIYIVDYGNGGIYRLAEVGE